MFQPQTVQVPCPLCGRRFTAQVQSIIDVGQDPAAKSKLLRGTINVATCPQCGNTGMLNVPFVYHDPDKELLLCYLPTELNLQGEDHNKLIGDLTNRLIGSLPPEKRKGYLLQPKTFLNRQRLMDEVVRAEGVTEEVLETQKAKLDLVNRFLDATSDEVLRVMVRENDGQLDYEFFYLLTGSIEMARAEGAEDRAQLLLALREKLLEFSSLGKAGRVEREVAEALEAGMTREEFLEKVLACESDAELMAVIALGRRMLDYQFFRSLTGRIETHEGEGKAEEAQRLKDLRSRILEIRDRLDAESRAMLRKKADLLREIFESEDLEEALRAHVGEIDEAFFAVLSANVEQAKSGGDLQAADRLNRLETLAFQLLDERTPWPIKFINQLLGAQYPRETKKLLEENVEQVDDELLKVMELVIKDLNRGGRKRMARQLGEIRDQAKAMLK